MPDRHDPVTEVSSPGSTERDVESVEAYEIDDATVLYDAENPLAWIESSLTVRIDEAA